MRVVKDLKSSSVVIPKGTIILETRPFAHVLKSYYRYTHCDHCLKTNGGKLLKCSGCQYSHYCDRLCQKQSWVIHKSECMNLKRILPRVIPDAARLMARIVVKLEKGGAEEKEYYDKYCFRKFKDLMSHYSDIKNDPKRMEHFTCLHEVLKEYMGEEALPNAAELLGIYGRICVNSYNIVDVDMNSVGVGIYLGPSIIDHSCKPNCVAIFEGTRISIRALVDMPQLDWANIRISYIDVLNTTNIRRSELQSSYYFLCECEKCKEPEKFESAAICPSCDEPCSIDQDSCKGCKKEITSTFRNKFNEVSQFTARYLENIKNEAYLDVSKTCLKRHANVLHPMNIQNVRVTESAFDASINLGYWEDAEKFGIELIPGYLHYYGEIHPSTGILYSVLGKIQLNLSKAKLALDSLSKAMKILTITHGEKHSLVRENLRPLLSQAIVENRK
ncbi:hypothetical protein QAD02_016655 [Eretmocerus hayati]|uniref:Uncharacterized protein n=1 Tax=Eretmocerus hayati TaxID=131215 RepID=A0ACC2PCQ9_9HYME|nr:hypothetical protein QAD02_016655 [Eretmocerus hayati]